MSSWTFSNRTTHGLARELVRQLLPPVHKNGGPVHGEAGSRAPRCQRH